MEPSVKSGVMPPVLSVDVLRELLASGELGVVIFDCRHRLTDVDFGRKAYAAGHLPGAHFAHLDEDLSGRIIPGVTGRHPLPDASAFARFMEQKGVSDKSFVVAYDDLGGALAARLWGMCRWVGHDAVAVLDGGYPAWIEAGYPITTDAPPTGTGTINVAIRNDMVVEAAGILSAARGTLVDARTGDRYEGRNETIDPVAGHIPGAVSMPFADNLDGTGRFKSSEELRERFSVLRADAAQSGARPIMYCGSGVTAAHNALAMVYAGLPEPVLYAGSWSDWITDENRPVAVGDEPGALDRA